MAVSPLTAAAAATTTAATATAAGHRAWMRGCWLTATDARPTAAAAADDRGGDLPYRKITRYMQCFFARNAGLTWHFCKD